MSTETARRQDETIGCSYPILLQMGREKCRLLMAAHDAYLEVRAHRDKPDDERFARAISAFGSAILREFEK